jgi:hypothetical protein
MVASLGEPVSAGMSLTAQGVTPPGRPAQTERRDGRDMSAIDDQAVRLARGHHGSAAVALMLRGQNRSTHRSSARLPPQPGQLPGRVVAEGSG